MIECPNCEKQISGTSCRQCGWSTPRPTYKPWVAPTYPDPPATLEEAKAAIAKIKAMLAGQMTAP